MNEILKVVIVEDEALAAENLIMMLKHLESNIEIQAQIESVEDAIQWFEENETDLIFLDIHLADDLSFKIFEKVSPKAFIIFTTAYNEYALRAFKLNSIDYLLKPIDANELQKALEKFRKIHPKNPQIDFDQILKTFQNQQNTVFQKRFMVNTGEKVKSIATEKIAYFFAESRYTFLVDEDEKKYIIDYTLDKLEEILHPDNFFRINRHLIVAFGAILEMNHYNKGRVRINLKPNYKGDSLVSLSRVMAFKNWLNR